MQGYFCKYCGKDLVNVKRKVHVCSNCNWKNKYFSGLYWEVLKRDDFFCKCCGIKLDKTKKWQFNVHHINHNPKDNRLENLETLCVRCHTGKRIAICKDCNVSFNAKSAHQNRCVKCAKKRADMLSYKRLAKYWKSRNIVKYNWYNNNYKICK
jgi:hypothetical protein